MSKSTIEQIVEVTRIVNNLDKRGRLAVLRDLKKQGLEIAEDQSVPPSGRVESGMVPEISVTRYKEGGE